MSESSRQSYYEVALTHRQVLVGFVVLLLGVVVAFLSGVWVGRQGAVAPVETVEAQTIDSGSEPGEEPLKRLDFFSRDPAAELEVEDGEAAAPPSGGEGEPAAGAAGDAAEPESPPAEPEAAEPEESPEGERTGRRGRRERADEERAEPQPEPEAGGPAPEPAPPAAETGGLVIQVFSSNNRGQAAQVAERLQAGGYPAQLSPVEVDGRTMYRVRIGPYSDRQIAEGVADQVRREFRLETWITE